MLLDQYDCTLPFEETDGKVIAPEQNVLDRSNELNLEQLAAATGPRSATATLDTYYFVLGVAWEQRDGVSLDEGDLPAQADGRVFAMEATLWLPAPRLG